MSSSSQQSLCVDRSAARPSVASSSAPAKQPSPAADVVDRAPASPADANQPRGRSGALPPPFVGDGGEREERCSPRAIAPERLAKLAALERAEHPGRILHAARDLDGEPVRDQPLPAPSQRLVDLAPEPRLAQRLRDVRDQAAVEPRRGLGGDQPVERARRQDREADRGAIQLGEGRPDLPSVTASLFLRVAALSPNREHRRAVALINDRLHAVRHHELAVLDDVSEELVALGNALLRPELARLRSLLAAYHRRRAKAVARLVQALYRGGS